MLAYLADRERILRCLGESFERGPFLGPVTRVGMYTGNGGSCLPVTPPEVTGATLTAYDESDDVVFSVTRNIVCAPVNVFIGIDAGAAVIRSLKLEYSRHEFAEAIDDLIFE